MCFPILSHLRKLIFHSYRTEIKHSFSHSLTDKINELYPYYRSHQMSGLVECGQKLAVAVMVKTVSLGSHLLLVPLEVANHLQIPKLSSSFQIILLDRLGMTLAWLMDTVCQLILFLGLRWAKSKSKQAFLRAKACVTVVCLYTCSLDI